MAISLVRGINWPFFQPLSPGNSNTTIDATGEKAAAIGYLHLTSGPGTSKTLDTTGSSAIIWAPQTVTFATSGSAIDIGIQGVSSSGPPGQPDGIFSVKKTLTQGTDTITANAANTIVPSTGTVTLSHGDLISIVADFITRNGSDSVVLTTNNNLGHGISVSGIPTGASYASAAWTSSHSPSFMLVFSDGTLGWIEGSNYLARANSTNYIWNDSSNPDERGIIFQVPFATSVSAMWFTQRLTDATSDCTLSLYSDPLGTPSSLTSKAIDAANMGAGGSQGFIYIPLTSAVNLSANTDYCLAIKATGAGNVRVEYARLLNADARKAMPGGETIFGVSRNNSSGAFGSSSSTDIIMSMGVVLNEIPSGGGGVPLIGTGGLVY